MVLEAEAESRPSSRSGVGSRPNSRSTNTGLLSVRFAEAQRQSQDSAARHPWSSSFAGDPDTGYIDHFPLPPSKVRPKPQKEYESYPHNGLFIDYLVRATPKTFDSKAAKKLLDLGGKGTVKESLVEVAGADVVKTEELLFALTEVFTDFYKKKDPSWKATGREFKEHARRLVKLKRQEVCLNAEVDNWIQRDHLLHPEILLPAPEGQEERQTRLQEFWTTYHSSYRIQDLPAEVSQEENDTEPSPGGEKKSKVVSRASSVSRPGTASNQAPSPGDAWKLRPSRSFCSRGGSRPTSSQSTTRPTSQASLKEAPGSDLEFPSLMALSRGTEGKRKAWGGLPGRSGRAEKTERSKTDEAFEKTNDESFGTPNKQFGKEKEVTISRRGKGVTGLEEPQESSGLNRFRAGSRFDSLESGPYSVLSAQTFPSTPTSSRPGSKYGRSPGSEEGTNRNRRSPAESLAGGTDSSKPLPSRTGLPNFGSSAASRASSAAASRPGSRGRGGFRGGGGAASSHVEQKVENAPGRFVGSLNKTLSLQDLQKWGFDTESPLFSSLGSPQMQDLKQKEEREAEAKRLEDERRKKEAEELALSLSKRLSLLQKKKLQMPHVDGAGVHAAKYAALTANCYVEACSNKGVLPSLLPFCTGHSPCLNAVGQGLSDGNLLAVQDMIPKLTSIREVNLEGNGLLTERSLTPLMELLKGEAAKNLQELNLKGCMRKMSPDSVQDVLSRLVGLLSNHLQRLRHLDLSGIHMTGKMHLSVCRVVSEHPAVKKVGLADIKLGCDSDFGLVAECMDLLLSNGSMLVLDLSWNTLDEESFIHMGQAVNNSGTLKHLSLASCACGYASGNSTAECFAELLAQDRSLASLDLSVNRIDFRGALVLEAALERNKTLKRLDLQHNPLSMLGLRSLLRLMARDTCAFVNLESIGCFASNGNLEAENEENQIFSETSPGGRYNLKLWRPYDRALLKMLYRTCHRFGLTPEQAFVDVKSNSGFQHPSRAADGTWPVPSNGEVTLTFSVQLAMEKFLSGVADRALKTASGQFSEAIGAVFDAMRIEVSFKKEVPLLALFKKMAGRLQDQSTMLEALSKDFQITCPMFSQLCSDKGANVDMAWKLIPNTLPNSLGFKGARFVSMLSISTMGGYLQTMKKAQRLLLFNVENPNGPYQLDLANFCDYSVVQQLVLLDRWECSLAEKKGLAVVSERPVRSQVRNARYQDAELQVNHIAEFNLPEHGLLCFDYSSLQKPPADAQPLDKEAWLRLLLVLQRSSKEAEVEIKAVVMTSHLWYLDSLQMRAIMGIFELPANRADIFVRLAPRLLDPHNEKLFRARFSDAEYQNLFNKLGYVFYFPFMQPEQTQFTLDLSKWDARLAAHLLILLQKEEGSELREARVVKEDGEIDNFLAGLPPSWQKFEQVDQSGILHLTYECSADKRKLQFRASLMEKYGYYTPPVEKIMWWTSLRNCPEDVVELVEYLNGKFKTLEEAFQIIDSGGSGQVSYKDFEDGVRRMECRKFSGTNERERIQKIFRFLDPDGGGAVSMNEWKVLDQIYQEVQLSVKEFVEFCHRTFGPDLRSAWQALDADGNQEISFAEWSTACERHRFFGPVKPIFEYLDSDDDGIISGQEFQILEVFEK